MIDRKKLLFYSLTPILTCSLLSGVGLASRKPAAPTQSSASTSQTSTTSSRSSKRAAKKAAKEAKKAKKAEAAKQASATTEPAKKRSAKSESKAKAEQTNMKETPAATAPAAKESVNANEKPTATRRTSAPANSTASTGEIANARAKGMVWVNTESKVYHKDGRYYGNTKHGKFMSESDAQKAGYKAAKK